MKISEISIKRPVFATMMIAALLVLGLFSYSEMSIELFPEVDFPIVVVRTVLPGASAESIEKEVTKLVEDAVNQISGIKHIKSTSREGYSLVVIEFELETVGAIAAQDVREKVAGIGGLLPEDTEDPVVSQHDMGAQAIMSITVAGNRSPKEITQLVKDRIKPRLEAITGVGSVTLIGGKEREILVAINPDKLEAYQITIDMVQTAIASANMEVPGGRIEEGSREYMVRMQGRLTSVEQFNSIIVKNREGMPIYLSDLAVIKDTIMEQRSLSRFDGNPTVALDIINQSGANVVDLADEVRKQLTNLEKELPPGIKLQIVQDQSIFIRDSIDEILFNIKFGTALAVIVIFMFLLDIRPTYITSLSIPISIIATFTVMNFLGFTINFMTLLGLSLAVGILIDDSIVVVENIYRRIQSGETPILAAFTGTKEIGLAVAATTFSIMVVFLPVAFMEGIIGRFFYQFGVTVAFAVLISLFVAFSLVPMLASRHEAPKEDAASLDPRRAKGLKRLWLRIRRVLSVWNSVFDFIQPKYKRMLSFSLRHRWVVVLLAIISFGSAIFMARLIGTEFVSQSDQNQMIIGVETRPGTTIEETSERLAEIEDILNRFEEVEGIYVTIGGGSKGVTGGMVLALLSDAGEREASVFEMIDSVRSLLTVIPGIKYSIASEIQEGGGAKPIELSVRGEDREELIKLAHLVEKIVHDTPGSTDVDNSLEEGKPELQIDIDRKAADDLGLNLGMIARTIRTFVEGDVVTRYQEGDDEYDVRVRLGKRFRGSERDLGRMLIESEKELPGIKTLLIPLDRVAKITRSTAIGEYGRYDRQPEVRINANVLTGSFAGTVTTEAQTAIDSLIQLPPGYIIAPVGTQEMMVESFTNIIRALVLAVIFIYLLLASQYESFFDPISIMISLPLSFVGATFGLLIFNSSFSIMSMIGIVMLMGLVTKNAILLIDFVKQERNRGTPRTEAILIAGPVRLRPILMTTLATVFGMLPLALGIGSGAEFRAPMARAVIGGVISSTLLTLVVVPVIYTLVDDVVGFAGRILFRKKKNIVREEIALDQ